MELYWKNPPATAKREMNRHKVSNVPPVKSSDKKSLGIESLSEKDRKKIADLVSELAKADWHAASLESKMQKQQQQFEEKLSTLSSETEALKAQERLAEQKLEWTESIVKKYEQDIDFFKKEIERLTESLSKTQQEPNETPSAPKSELNLLQERIDRIENWLVDLREQKPKKTTERKDNKSAQLQTLLKTLMQKHKDFPNGKSIDMSEALSELGPYDSTSLIDRHPMSRHRDSDYEKAKKQFLRKKVATSPQPASGLHSRKVSVRSLSRTSAYDRVAQQPKQKPESYLFESDTSMAKSLLDIVDDLENTEWKSRIPPESPRRGADSELSWDFIKKSIANQ